MPMEKKGAKKKSTFCIRRRLYLRNRLNFPQIMLLRRQKCSFMAVRHKEGGGGKKSTNNSEKNLYDGAPSLCLVASQLMWACCTFVDFAYCCTHNLAIESCATHASSNSRKKKKKKKDK